MFNTYPCTRTVLDSVARSTDKSVFHGYFCPFPDYGGIAPAILRTSFSVRMRIISTSWQSAGIIVFIAVPRQKYFVVLVRRHLVYQPLMQRCDQCQLEEDVNCDVMNNLNFIPIRIGDLASFGRRGVARISEKGGRCDQLMCVTCILKHAQTRGSGGML